MKGGPVGRAQKFVRVYLWDVLSPWMGLWGVAPWDVLEAWMLAFKQGLSCEDYASQADLYSRAEFTVGL